MARHGRLEFLDALRGLAILGVLCIHAAHLSGGGFPGYDFAVAGAYGVQLFFMISAFTIFMTLDGSSSPRGERVRNFFIRRFFRILPMFWLGLALYAFVPGREEYAQHFNITASYYLLTSLLMHGWHPFLLNSVVPGGWSIAVEGTFYLFAPLLFYWIRSWRGALGFLLASFLIPLAADKTALWLYFHHLAYTGVHFEMLSDFLNRWFPLQVPVFACGILAYQIFKALPQTFRTKTNGHFLLMAAAVGIYSILGSVSGINVHLIPSQTFLALCFLLLMLGLAIHPLPLIVNPALCLLGRISYSFYLIHFVFVCTLAERLHRFHPSLFAHPLFAFALLVSVTLLLTTCTAYLTYLFVEQPGIGLGRGLIKRLNARAHQPPGLRASASLEISAAL